MVLAMTFILVAVPISAEEPPMEVEAEGSYLMGDRDSRQDARKLALFEAKRQALEKAGTTLSSVTKVENYEVVKDEIINRSAGRIQAAVLDEKWESSGVTMICRVRIRAKVYAKDLQAEVTEPAVTSVSPTDPVPSARYTGTDQLAETAFDPGEQLAAAQKLIRGDRFKAALEILERLEERYPNLSFVHGLKARALMGLRKPNLALQSLTRACDLGERRACEELQRVKEKIKRGDRPAFQRSGRGE